MINFDFHDIRASFIRHVNSDYQKMEFRLLKTKLKMIENMLEKGLKAFMMVDIGSDRMVSLY